MAATTKKTDAAATVEKTVAEQPKKMTPAQRRAYMNEKVPFMAPIVKKDEPDLFVAVNGRNFQIQRGKQVMLPRYVVRHLQNVEAQRVNIIKMQMAKQQNTNSAALK